MDSTAARWKKIFTEGQVDTDKKELGYVEDGVRKSVHMDYITAMSDERQGEMAIEQMKVREALVEARQARREANDLLESLATSDGADILDIDRIRNEFGMSLSKAKAGDAVPMPMVPIKCAECGTPVPGGSPVPPYWYVRGKRHFCCQRCYDRDVTKEIDGGIISDSHPDGHTIKLTGVTAKLLDDGDWKTTSEYVYKPYEDDDGFAYHQADKDDSIRTGPNITRIALTDEQRKNLTVPTDAFNRAMAAERYKTEKVSERANPKPRGRWGKVIWGFILSTLVSTITGLILRYYFGWL